MFRLFSCCDLFRICAQNDFGYIYDSGVGPVVSTITNLCKTPCLYVLYEHQAISRYEFLLINIKLFRLNSINIIC